VQQVREHESGGPSSDDTDLRAHDPLEAQSFPTSSAAI
jgi:hypothetical protein